LFNLIQTAVRESPMKLTEISEETAAVSTSLTKMSENISVFVRNLDRLVIS